MKSLLMTLAATAGLSGAFADSTWILDSATPTGWFTEAAWSVYPPSGKVTLGKKGFANIFLEAGDAVDGLTDIVTGVVGVPLVFQVRKGASLTFTGTMTAAGNNPTNVIDFAGGTVRGNSFQPGPGMSALDRVFVTNGADVAFASLSCGRLGPVDLLVDGARLAVTNGALVVGRADKDVGARAFLRKAALTSGGLTVQVGGKVGMEASSADLNGSCALEYGGGELHVTNVALRGLATASAFSLGSAKAVNAEPVIFEICGEASSVSGFRGFTANNNVRYVQRDGTVDFTLPAKAQVTVAGLAGSVQALEVSGGLFAVTNENVNGSGTILMQTAGRATFRQTGGTVRTYGVRFAGTGAENPRYEISGGTFQAIGAIQNLATTVGLTSDSTAAHNGTFSIVGGSPTVRVQRVGNYNKTDGQPQLEYVICTNGVAPIVLEETSVSVYNHVNGYFTIRPQGGVQVLHGDTVTLLDGSARGAKLTCKDVGAGGTIFPAAELWRPPEETSNLATVEVALNAAAEVADGATLGTGRSRGWLRLPKVRHGITQSIVVKLALVPQGETTLDELVAGFAAAGYEAGTIAEDGYNVSLSIPAERLADRSAAERLVFDFCEYPTPEAVRAETPVVRARVTKATAEKAGLGLLLLIR